MSRHRFLHKTIALLFACAVPLAASAAGLEIKVAAYREVPTAAADGSKANKLEPLQRAQPGQVVVYVLAYRNTGNKPAANVVLNNPVPKEMRYVADSATGDNARAEVSVDGGKQFGALEALKVKNADGSTRTAAPGDVTTLRWTLLAPVKPGAEGTVSYRALLK